MSAWSRRSGESREAFAAFQHYLNEGTIDAAYARAKPDQNQIGKRAPAQWFQWSSKHEWVSRAAAYADHLAELDRAEIERRKREQRELEWEIVRSGLQIVRDALPSARQFIRQQRTVIPARDGQPEQIIITLSFDMVGLTTSSEKLGKQGRLANDQPTEHIQLSGAALDAYISSQMARLAHAGEAGAGDAPGDDAAETDPSTDADAYDL